MKLGMMILLLSVLVGVIAGATSWTINYCSYTTYDTPASATGNDSCGGYCTQPSGEFTSPLYPSDYPNYADCSWHIQSTGTKIIRLTFTFVRLERCCTCDYVSVYDGSSIYSPLLGKLCNNDTGRGPWLPSSHKARVTCSSDSMNIVIRRSYLDSLGISWYDLYVDDHRCRSTVDSYEVSFNFPFYMCGTSMTTNNGCVVYNNHVRAAPSQSGEITRETEHFLLNVHCHMEQDTTVGTVYKVKELVNDTISGTGRFNASINFYPSSSFYYPIIESPYEVDINQYMYVQVQLNRADSTLDILLDSCITSPNPGFTARSYTLIQNGSKVCCPG